MNSRFPKSASFESLKRIKIYGSIITNGSPRVKISVNSVVSVVVFILSSIIRLERCVILTVKALSSRYQYSPIVFGYPRGVLKKTGSIPRGILKIGERPIQT